MGGELAINQREPLPATGREDDYSSPVVVLGNTTGLTTEQYMTEILQEYNERDGKWTAMLSPHANLSVYV